MSKVFVIHPGKQHSFQLATALKKADMLGRYITSVYNRPGSLSHFIANFCKGDLKKKINGRRCDFLNDQEVIQFCELGVMITLFLNHFPRLQRLAEYWNFFIESLFYKKVMRYVKREHPDAIVIYNGYAKKHLEKLKGTGIPIIMDMSIAKREYIRDILQKEIESTGFSEIRKMHFSYWNKTMQDNDYSSCLDVDYFLVPSMFVYDSLISSGITKEKIKHVPYGVDINNFKPLQKRKHCQNHLKLIYVGSVTYRKGIHRLLSVTSKFTNVEIFLVGTYDKKSLIYQNFPENKNTHYLGFVTRDKLNSLLNECDAFVLPSFCEGMAMAGIEGMAAGLPLICTYYTGVNDLIENKRNGFVYHAEKEDELYNCITWLLQHEDKIDLMGREALKTAQQYTWEHYHKNVATVISKIANKG